MKGKRIHFMGVGGAGCSAAFAIAHAAGFQVSGCDQEETSPYLDKKLKRFVTIGHDSTHLKGVDAVVYSPAVTSLDSENEELRQARISGLKTSPWDEFVAAQFLKGKFVIAIAGTHGKGTVSAMVGVLLEKAGLDPTCLVGAVVVDWGKNYRIGKSKYFVIEADEYIEKFLNFSPNIAVITNIEFDHPEYFKNLDHLKKTFKKFVDKLQKDSVLVIGPGVDLENTNGKTKKITKSRELNLKMIGEFNQINAAVALSIAQELGIERHRSTKILENFRGLSRRFEFKGEEKGVLVFDDYAHHPTAVSETLKAVRDKFPEKKILVVYQPHLFTRTYVFFDDFVKSLSEAPVDEIILVDIFAARERNKSGVTSADLAKAVGRVKTKYAPSLEWAATYLAKEASVGEVVISMGAGDIYKLPDRLLEKLKGKG